MTEDRQNAGKMKRLLNVPNILTISRIVLSIILFGLFPFEWYRTCFVLFIIAALTDYVDGWWARRYDQKTQFGRIMDPFADKALVCGALICLVAAPGLHDLFPGSCVVPIGLATWMVIAIIMREMFVTMLRSMVESHGGDFSAKWVGKWKTTLQCFDVPMGILILVYDAAGETAPLWLRVAFVICLYIVVYLTLYSGWVYIRAAMAMSKSSGSSEN